MTSYRPTNTFIFYQIFEIASVECAFAVNDTRLLASRQTGHETKSPTNFRLLLCSSVATNMERLL